MRIFATACCSSADLKENLHENELYRSLWRLPVILRQCLCCTEGREHQQAHSESGVLHVGTQPERPVYGATGSQCELRLSLVQSICCTDVLAMLILYVLQPRTYVTFRRRKLQVSETALAEEYRRNARLYSQPKMTTSSLFVTWKLP
jgi:hypothetical protein